jgi:biotin carboxylase
MPGDLGDCRALARLSYPQIVKPVDAGGGLGVFVVHDAAQRAAVLASIDGMANYGGGRFSGVLVEESLSGREFSIQGVVANGTAIALTVCEKLVVPDVQSDGTQGVRELGHIAVHGGRTPAALQAAAQSCVEAVGYRQGAFHLDAIVDNGRVGVLEMGFRLSGAGLPILVEQASGARWAELIFLAHLGDGAMNVPLPAQTANAVGQVALEGARLAAAAEDALTDPSISVHYTTNTSLDSPK